MPDYPMVLLPGSSVPVPDVPAEHYVQYDREAKLIYSILVAGKSATFANDKTKVFLAERRPFELPFELLARLIKEKILDAVIRKHKLGNYGKLAQAFAGIVAKQPDLLTCGPTDLEEIHGIGPKTSRFFIMWIRPEECYAALDVHVLRWLRTLGHQAPKATPTGRKYRELELVFLAEAKKRGKTPRQLDSEIWEAGASARNVVAGQ